MATFPLRHPFLLVLLALTACAVRSPMWYATGEPGPPLATGSPTTHVEQCDVVNFAPFPPGGRTCAHAFQSKDGSRVTFAEVATEIEGNLAQAVELRPHLRDYERQFQPDPKRRVQHQRYRLYLVGLRPVVVVGVPVSGSDSCNAPGGSQCFTVQDPKGRGPRSFSGWSGGVYYVESPRVLPGSFVVVPASGMESTQLPVSTVRFGVPGTSSFLVNSAGYWKLQP